MGKRLLDKINLLQKLATYGDRASFLNSIAQSATRELETFDRVSPVRQPTNFERVSPTRQPTDFARTTPIKVPEQVITNEPQPQLPANVVLPETVIEGTPPAQKPVEIKPVNIVGKPPVKPMPQATRKLPGSRSASYAIDLLKVQAQGFSSQEVSQYSNLDEFGNPKPKGIPAPPANKSVEIPTVHITGKVPNPIIKQVQHKLHNMGWGNLVGAIDGILGPKTQAALNAFKAASPWAAKLTGDALYNAILGTTK